MSKCIGEEDCPKPARARGMCSTHLSRERRGHGMTTSVRACAGCLTEFRPTRTDQKYCTRPCGKAAATRRRTGQALVMPRMRTCPECGGTFSRNSRREYCSNGCGRTAAIARHHERIHNISPIRRAQLLGEQNGLCAICNGPPSDDKRLCLDHDHDSGQVRGFLCDTCNRAIGLLGDDIDLLMAAVAYLTKHRAQAAA